MRKRIRNATENFFNNVRLRNKMIGIYFLCGLLPILIADVIILYNAFSRYQRDQGEIYEAFVSFLIQ